MAKGKYERWLEPEGLCLLEDWARNGLTDDEIARKMGVNVATLYRWKSAHCEICEALKKGKDVVDAQVESALLKRALGYDYQEERIEMSTKDGKKVIQTLKHIPPDTTALIFWLKNRRKGTWRDKPDSRDTVEPRTNLLDRLSDVAAEDISTDDIRETE